MVNMELRSPSSHSPKTIEEWVENNKSSNDVAFRLMKKYFRNGNQLNSNSKYFVVVTGSGGVLLKKDVSMAS